MTADPSVAVLLATHQGEAYIEEQVRSILDQRGVRVRLVVSDDGSTDGTLALLAVFARDPRVVVLPPARFGSPQANFLRLIREADVGDAVAVALADQDDRWHLDKLQRQLDLLAEHDLDAVSSNVVAFWSGSDGERMQIIDKAKPQTELDFLLESGGPGCTFLVRAAAFEHVREVVRARPVEADALAPHDWLVYAIVRASGGRWRIDAEPTLDYRQHGRNATGANRGIRQLLVRISQMRAGHYRKQCATVARVAASVAADPLRRRLERIVPLLERSDFGSRAALRRLTPELRRDPRERTLLRLALLLGLW